MYVQYISSTNNIDTHVSSPSGGSSQISDIIPEVPLQVISLPVPSDDEEGEVLPPLFSDDEEDEVEIEEGEIIPPLSDDEDEETDDSIHVSDWDISSDDSGYDTMSDEDEEEFEDGSPGSPLIRQFPQERLWQGRRQVFPPLPAGAPVAAPVAAPVGVLAGAPVPGLVVAPVGIRLLFLRD